MRRSCSGRTGRVGHRDRGSARHSAVGVSRPCRAQRRASRQRDSSARRTAVDRGVAVDAGCARHAGSTGTQTTSRAQAALRLTAGPCWPPALTSTDHPTEAMVPTARRSKGRSDQRQTSSTIRRRYTGNTRTRADGSGERRGGERFTERWDGWGETDDQTAALWSILSVIWALLAKLDWLCC